jgi:hypothetical protein
MTEMLAAEVNELLRIRAEIVAVLKKLDEVIATARVPD